MVESSCWHIHWVRNIFKWNGIATENISTSQIFSSTASFWFLLRCIRRCLWGMAWEGWVLFRLFASYARLISFLHLQFPTVDDADNDGVNVTDTNLQNKTREVLRESHSDSIEISSGMLVSGTVVFIYIVASTLREVIQVTQKRHHYLLEPINLVSWILYGNALIMISPIFTNGHVCDYLFSAASLTVFLSWFNLLLHLQRFDQIGIYVVMFLEILQTLIKVLVVFSILIIAFGLAFFILLSSIHNPQPNHLSFTTIPMSLMRTFSMMLGEMDIVNTFIQPYHMNYLPYPYASFAILCELTNPRQH